MLLDGTIMEAGVTDDKQSSSGNATADEVSPGGASLSPCKLRGSEALSWRVIIP